MPDPATLSAGCILASLVLYALFGGADFGGGFWNLLARGPRATDRRRLIARAIGPVWETNHIWIIVVIVILFTAFPGAFAVVCTALFVPLTIVLAGIVLRGAAFAFHTYRLHEERSVGRWGVVFASASLVTPVFLGIVFGAISSGRIRATDPLAYTGDVRSWLSPFPISLGFLALASFAFLAAVYLILETDDPGLREVLLRDAFRAAAAQVSLLLIGWGMAQYPYLVRPDITILSAAASPGTLRFLLGALAAGAAFLFPAIFLLLRVFKWEAISGTPRRP